MQGCYASAEKDRKNQSLTAYAKGQQRPNSRFEV